MLKLTFENVLYIYKDKMFITKMRYNKGIIDEKEFKAKWVTNNSWLYELKYFFDNYYKTYTKEDFTSEEWAKLQETYSYEEDKPYKLVVYRGVIIPILSDDYGQQDYTVLFGEVYGGGAYNFNAVEDFCNIVDYHLEKQYMSDANADWAEEINPLAKDN